MASDSPPAGYAGDVEPAAAWKVLASDPSAQLVDVRSAPEWAFVGLPDLSPVGRAVLKIEWQIYPAMAVNPAFAASTGEGLKQAGAGPDTPVFFLCRSGARSRAAAVAMTKAGFTRAYNVAGGFEGDPDTQFHRGQTNGWKAAGLPWKQT